MKYALYDIDTKIITQWQDTEVLNYNDPIVGQARLELTDGDLPSGFDPYTWPTGWWVVNGVCTQTAPPPTNGQLAQALRYAATARRYNSVLAGVVLADSTVFAPSDTDLSSRIMPVALGRATLGITDFDILLGGAWKHFTAVELEGAYIALMQLREALYSAESVHLQAIDALFAAGDRTGLETYDLDAGWPATSAS